MTSSDDRLGGEAVIPPPVRSPRPFLARVLLITDGQSLPEDASVAQRVSPSDEHQRLEATLSAVLSAVPPGTLAVQLRNRQLSTQALHDRAVVLRALTSRHGAPLLINDRLDVALAVDADGVHLPGRGLPPHIVRRFVGSRLQICAAAHGVTEARLLAQAGADAVTLSPIWPTPSKPTRPSEPDGVRPLGLDVLALAVRSLPVPVFALGGIDTVDRVAACSVVGARAACLRALLPAAYESAAARAAAFVAAAQPHFPKTVC